MKDLSIVNNRKTFKIHLTSYIFLLLTIHLFGCKEKDTSWETKFPSCSVSRPAQYDVPFTGVPEISDIVLYEVNVRAFSNSGDLKGLQQKLDSLKSLGINVVWLMPIYETGKLKSVGSPYAVSNYLKISDDLGTLEDLRLLVKEAHSLDIAVMLDWVANHTSFDNEWISNKDWYAQNDEGEIVQPPGTNWTDVAELDYSNSNMRQAMIAAMKYWALEANIDGFRCDYAHGVPVDFWEAAIDTLRSIPNRKFIMFAESGEKNLLSAGFDMIFGWNFYRALKQVFNKDKAASDLISTNTSDYNGVGEGQQIVRWITNHDQDAWDGSPLDIFNGTKPAMAAFLLSTYLDGVPLIYSGQEVGQETGLPFFTNNIVKINWNNNNALREEYKSIISVYNQSSALRKGNINSYSSQDIAAFKKVYKSEEILVIVNVRATSKTFEVPGELENTQWKNAFDGSDVNLSGSIQIESYQYLILKK